MIQSLLIGAAMATEFKRQIYKGRPVSPLGFRLWKLREQIEAAAERGETRLLSREELDREFEQMRPGDPDGRHDG